MKVEVVKKFKDKNTGEIRDVGEIFVCNKARYEEIVAVGEYVRPVKTEKE